MAERLSKDELAERLTALAPRMISGGTRVENLVRLTGGASMATWAFDAVDGEGQATPLILRRRDRPVEYSTGRSRRRRISGVACPSPSTASNAQVAMLAPPVRRTRFSTRVPPEIIRGASAVRRSANSSFESLSAIAPRLV